MGLAIAEQAEQSTFTKEQQLELKSLCEDALNADIETEYKPFDSLGWWLEDHLGEIDSPTTNPTAPDELKNVCRTVVAADGDVDYKTALLLMWALADCRELAA